MSNQLKRYTIVRRYNEFEKFSETMKQKYRLKCPELPGKKISITPDQLEQRRKGLELFIAVILNERIYFKEEMSKFFGISIEDLEIEQNGRLGQGK